MNRQRKINCMTFTERKREIERAGESGREGGERERDRLWKERSKGKGKAEGREGKMTHAVCSRLVFVHLFAQHIQGLFDIIYISKPLY